MTTSANEAPAWLLAMRALDGTTEVSGSGNSPRILAMRDRVARRWASTPGMEAYCALYQNDLTPWCGLCVADCFTTANIHPAWGPKDTDRFFWARSFDSDEWGYKLSVPRPGCVVIMSREGGGHVTLFERQEGSTIYCRGGNQSNSVNQSAYSTSNVVSYRWPKAEGPPPPAPRRSLKLGATGADVGALQLVLGIPADEEFGAVTDSGVRGFQAACALEVDGEVGPATWEKVDALAKRLEAGSDGLSDERKHAIVELALTHPIQHYVWKDRGRSPSGYIAGIGQCFALALIWLAAHDPAAVEMAQAAGDTDEDALAWYAAEFARLDLENDTAGAETLRNLFALIIGLCMRESSGKYYEGIDVSAGSSSTSADTCEAGLAQMSWNMRTCSPNMPKLLETFFNDPNGFFSMFSEGLTPTAGGLRNYGTGQGVMFQFIAKRSPAAAVMMAGLGLRKRRKHWGPIVRREVELAAEAIDYLRQVAALELEVIVPEPTPEPEPEPPPLPEIATVQIETVGPIQIFVNGVIVS